MSRTSRVLLVLALIALAGFALFELPRRRTGERERVDARRLFPPFEAIADRVDIVRPEGRLRVEVRGTHWEVVEPVADAAEYARIATLIDAVSRGEVARNLGSDDDAARFGLNPPVATVTVAAGADTLAHLELGAHTIDRGYVYARRRDGDVVLVAPSILSAATLPFDAYRDQSVVRFDVAEVEGFTLRVWGQEDVRWNRRGDVWYTVVDGDTILGDPELVLMHVRRFKGMRVHHFVTSEDTVGLSPGVGSVTLYKRPPAPSVTIRFKALAHYGSPPVVFWARTDGDPRVVEVDGDVRAALKGSVDTLRDRRLLHFSPGRARRIHVVTPDTSAVLVRAGDRWALPNPALGSIDPGYAGDFVRYLRALRYTRVLDEAPAPDVEPATFTLAVTAEGDTILDELRGRPLGPASRDMWIVTSRSARVRAELPGRELNTLLALLRRLRTETP